MNIDEYRAYQERKSVKQRLDEMTKNRVSQDIRKDALSRSFATLQHTLKGTIVDQNKRGDGREDV